MSIPTLLRLAEFSRDAVIVADEQRRVIYLNPRASRLFDYPGRSGRGLPVDRLLPGVVPDIRSAARPSGQAVDTRWYGEGLTRAGRRVDLSGMVTRLVLPTGPCHLYTLRPQDDRDRALDAQRQDALGSLVYRNTSEGMLVLDPKGFILDVNPAFARLRGRVQSEVIGRHVRCLNSSCHSRAFYQAMWRSVMETGGWQGEHWGQHASGEFYPEWLSINTSYTRDGAVHRRVMIFSNITEIKRAEALIWKQANFDRLTDLPNRQMFQARLEQSIRQSRGAESRTCLLFLDLDRFKEINDTLGHAIGDELLKEAARRLSTCVRQGDTVARLGGDEFTILLNNVRDSREVERLARNVLRTLARPFDLGVETVFISASIGITCYPDDGTDAEALLNNADQAMYAAKAGGRNRRCYFTSSMQEQARTRMRLVNDLHLAVDQGQLALEFQPIIDMSTGRIVKAEALLRWHHPERGLVEPVEFVPLAEETGIIRVIGDWVFCEATRQVAQWQHQHGRSIQVSVNISPVQFRHEGLDHGFWRSHLETLGLAPDRVVVEITEGLLIDSEDHHVRRQLAAFRDTGIRVALDDFGTGYSSLSYLRKFDIDYLKVDQSFVSSVGPDSPDLVLCEAVILLAHKFGLRVIAEGLESAQQYELLRAAGCDFGQGYLFAAPMPPDAFARLLAADGDLRSHSAHWRGR